MLAVKLWGGLGNQMFQYAFGKHLETIRDEEVFFYTIPFNNEFNRDLHNFRVNLNITSINHLRKNLILPVNEFIYRAERKLVQKLPFINSRLFVENSLYYNPEIKKNAVLFDGYWQSYKYFADIGDLITSEFKLKDEISQSQIPEIAQITTSDSVSVHIRHGDYHSAKNKQVFVHCNKEYYTKAIEKIKNSVRNPVFFIFSDDIESIEKEKQVFGNIDFKIIDNTKNKNSTIADFILMSQCKHNIVANSTYSWWAAWLNSNPQKVVIAPEKWYSGKLNDTTTDLIPSSWIRV